MMLAPPAAPTNTELRVLAEISSYDDLHNALRRRSDELQVSRTQLDAATGLQSGYVAKLLAPVPTKRVGIQSLGPLLIVLGVKLVMVEDLDSLRKISLHLEKRDERAVRQLAVGKRKKRRVYPKRSSEWGKFMAARRVLSQSPKKRSQIARIAGVSRWLKWRDIKEAARAAAKPIMSKGAREARLRLDTKSNGGTRG
jgi:hypothetical protein